MRTRSLLIGLLVATSLIAPVAGAAEGGPLDLEVLVDGQSAMTAPGPTVTPGDDVVIKYKLHNSTSEWQWSFYLYQEGIGRLTCSERHIAPNSTVTCKTTITAEAGEQAAYAFVTAWPESGGVEDEEMVYYTGATAPAPTTTTTTTTTTVPAPPSSGLVNLALGKPTSQSGVNSWSVGTPSGRAVDGDRNGDHDAGSVAVTYRVSDAWWEVDLGAVYDIDHVVLWNRTDCCVNRLRKFHVFVSDVPFEVKDIKDTQSQVGVLDIYNAGPAERETTVPVGRTGRYVRVQLDYTDAVLQLAEVEVMGSGGGGGGASVPAPSPTPSITLEARIAGSDADASPGPTIARGSDSPMQFLVENTGSVELWGLWVQVPGFGTATCPQRHLIPGASAECTLPWTASSGTYSVSARAVAYDEADAAVDVRDPIVFFVPDANNAAVKLDFLVDGLNGDNPAGPRIKAGQVMTFTYLVSNTGAVPLTGVRVRDDSGFAVGCPTTTVQPGDTLVCSRKETATMRLAHLQARVNTAEGATDTENLYFHVKDYGREDDLALEVSINGHDADAPTGPQLVAGSTATIRYVLTNNAYMASLWDAEILDPAVPAGHMNCQGGPTLGIGENMVCTATIVIGQGQWSNLVIAHAWSQNGPRIDASDRLHYYGIL